MKKVLLLVLFSLGSYLFAQPKEKFETIFSINNDKTTKKEYLFKEVMGIITDDENNFYVFENFGTEIRKYSKDGKYIRTISREGAGPGEIKLISQAYINQSGEIVVHDPPNYRITYFNLDGKYLRSVSCKSENSYLSKVGIFDASSFIAIKQVYTDKLEHTNKIIIYDNNLQNTLTSFGHSSIFWKYSDAFEKHMSEGNRLNYVVLNNKVFVTKEYYDGHTYIFDKSKNWEAKIVEGRRIKNSGYEIIEKSIDKIDWKSYTGANVCFGEEWGGKNRVFTIFYRYASIGFLNYKEKYLLDFLVSCVKPREYEFGIDMYNIDGAYLGYNRLDINGRISLRDKVFCFDKEGNFYMKTNGEEIRKIKLTIN